MNAEASADSVAARRDAHVSLVEGRGLSAAHAGRETGYNRQTVIRDLDRARAERAGTAPATPELRARLHWRLVRLDGLTLTQAGRQTGSPCPIVIGDLAVRDAEATPDDRFEVAWRRAERRNEMVCTLPSWWREVPQRAAAAGIDERTLTGVIEGTIGKAARAQVSAYSACAYVAGAVRRITAKRAGSVNAGS